MRVGAKPSAATCPCLSLNPPPRLLPDPSRQCKWEGWTLTSPTGVFLSDCSWGQPTCWWAVCVWGVREGLWVGGGADEGCPVLLAIC